MRDVIWLVSGLIVGCGGSPPTDSTTDTDLEDTDLSEDTDPSSDTDLPVQHLDLAPFQAALEAALPDAPAGVEGISLVVFNADDASILDLTVGNFSRSEEIPVASASKLVSALILLRLVDEGVFTLETPVDQVLTWPTPPLHLDHLGAFASGLPGDAPCAYQVNNTLQHCVQEIASIQPIGAPGTTFDYGPTHLHIAGAMAEVLTNESWAHLFQSRLGTPLGLTGGHYATLPKFDWGRENPLVAGGLIISTNDYLKILRLFFHHGELNGSPYINTGRMEQNLYVDAAVEGSPMQLYGWDHYYGWGTWLECDGPVTTCPVISSPGAFGFTPWIDREHHLYGIVAMEASTQGAAQFSTGLAKDIRAEIARQLESSSH